MDGARRAPLLLAEHSLLQPLPPRIGARGHFPDEQSALRLLYLTVQHRDKNRANPTGRINNWSQILNTLTLTFGDRLGLN